MTQLEDYRLALDALDREMVGLFEKRMTLSRAVADYKAIHCLPILDAGREEAVLKSRAAMLRDPSLQVPLTAFMKTLMALSRDEQAKHLKKEDAHA